MNQKNPKVFVCHAGDDNDRFVIAFAKKLREKGIDAWVDKWEMLPGDSLVEKIFEEGLKEAQAVIVVVSQHSVSKPWVREEINAAFVKKVENKCKLIPIVLDDVNVPECLKSTVWESIKDLTHFEESFNRVVNSIFGYTEKPKIGTPPKYTSTIIDNYVSSNKIDNIIFSAACELAIEKGIILLNSSELYKRVALYDIDEAAFAESLDVLDRKGIIKAERVMGGGIPCFHIKTYGMDCFIRATVEDFDSIVKRVCTCIVNSESDNLEMANKLNRPIVIINHVFYLLQQKGLISFSEMQSGNFYIHDVSPELKRSLE